MLALLDGDIFVYRVGFTTQEEPEGIALARLDESIGATLKFLNTTDYRCFLTPTDKSNFRYEIYSQYKANRTAPKPHHYDLLRDHLLNWHGAIQAWGEEADDLCGIQQSSETCIVSIDKDLRQVPGLHFNFVKGIIDEVSELDGSKSFYRSLLTGDRVDNISGISGVGPIKAAKLINHLNTPKEMYNVVVSKYKRNDKSPESLVQAGQLLWIRREEGQLWHPPV